jgi:hypothetical protein
MEFKKYQHLERLGTQEVQGIEKGRCYIFPKIDGTNSSIWLDNDGITIKAGSRNRELSLEDDNAGFYRWVLEQSVFAEYFKEFPDDILYGEWLVPHTLRTYNEDAWRKFYVFDIFCNGAYIDYSLYDTDLAPYGIEYIKPLAIINNPEYDDIVNQLDKNTFLIKEGAGFGEGIVIKNYDFVNKQGRTVWAKVVSDEFKVSHKSFVPSKEKDCDFVEQSIVEKYVTKSFVDKELAKIVIDEEWNSKMIPKLLGIVSYSLLKEESYNFIKEFKMPTINFKTLNQLVIRKVKELKPELF